MVILKQSLQNRGKSECQPRILYPSKHTNWEDKLKMFSEMHASKNTDSNDPLKKATRECVSSSKHPRFKIPEKYHFPGNENSC